MIRYLLKRIVMTLMAILLVMFFLSVLVNIVPGDPAEIMLGPRASTALIKQVRQEMYLDKPVYAQVWHFFYNAVHGNLGHDFFSHQPVTALIGDVLPHTLILAVAALLLSALVGIPLGVFAATKPNTWTDRLSAIVSISFITTPYYVAGLYLLLLFALHWALLPAIGAGSLDHPWSYLTHLILPASALAITWIGYIARLVRASMLEILNANYVRTARAFGLSQRKIYYKYALKNAVIPAVAVLTMALGDLMSGAVFVEMIFSRSGLGSLIVHAIQNRNYPVVRGSILVIALIYIFANLAADLCYRWLDPRIRVEEVG